MDMPAKDDPIWEDLVTGKKACSLRFLAAKILLGRLTRSVAGDSSPENIQASAEALHDMFTNNQATPSAKADLLVLCGRAPGLEARSRAS